MLLPHSFIEDSIFSYLPKRNKKSNTVYLSIIILILALLAVLPILHTDVSVTAQGIIRPVSERTEVKPVINGIINKLYYKEGDTILQDAVLLTLKDPSTKSKTLLNDFEIKQGQQFIHDLQLLSSITLSVSDTVLQKIANQLQSPLYKEQAIHLLHQKGEQDILLKKVNKDLEINTVLIKDKIISPKEFFDIQIQAQRQQASGKALVQEQLSNWQQDLAKYKMELSQYQQQTNQITTDASYYEVKAPIGGVIQGINNRYPGGYLQANETVCSISPSGKVLAECYVPATNIGLIKLQQEVRFQIDAFDYNYFGIVTGKVQSVDNDYSIVDNKPMFKVRCSFDNTQVHLKNGYAGDLKKGLTFQSRFIVAKRSLWQLLWDKIDDWLNPSSPTKAS